jgi:hypothetical protein
VDGYWRGRRNAVIACTEVKIIKALLLLLIALPVFAADVELYVQPMHIEDDAGNILDLPGSTRWDTAQRKLKADDRYYDGDYWLIGRHRLEKTGNPSEPVVIPPDPIPDPVPDTPTVAASLSNGIVYSRIKRTIGPIETSFGSTTYTLNNPDLWDALPEVAKQFSDFSAPGQLVHLAEDGTETILYDCFTKLKPCVPLDASVSLDGTKVAFAVYRSDNLTRPWPANRNIPVDILGGTNNEARIYVHDLTTGLTTEWPHIAGHKESSPVWLANGKMMFSSTRDGQYGPRLNGIAPKGLGPRLFIAEQDGTNVVDITPHEVAGALHPYMLSTGRVAYGSLWLSHNLAYIGTNGGMNWPTTIDNMWMVSDIDQEGGDMTALLGGHRASFAAADGRSKNLKALHFIGERANGDACVGNYYRGNNKGLGDVICFPPQPKGIEGPAPSFLPTDIYNVANWSKSNDERSHSIDGIYQGKIGFPEGTADNQLILTVGTGYCTTVAIAWNAEPNLGDQPGCDVGLYKTTVIPSLVKSDMELIVDDPAWHEFNARVIRPRTVANVAMTKTGDDTCILASSDAGSTDAHGKKPYNFNSNYFNMANNGGEIDGLAHSELAAIRFYEIIPNATKFGTSKNTIGNDVRLLGDVPLLADNSFKVQLPCDTPYTLAGVDSDGLIIKRDQIPQSLRPGEKRTCGGCHLHGEEGRAYSDSLAFTADPFPLLLPTPVPSFEADIKPMLATHCGSCHTADLPIDDYAKLAWDVSQVHVKPEWQVQMSTSTRKGWKYGLQRPYISKYINSMFARESLLYWKAANERTDGRTDSTYDNDIDFGADHPTTITTAEIKTLGAWIDAGAAK